MPNRNKTASPKRKPFEQKPLPGKMVKGASMEKKLTEAKAFSARIKQVREQQPA